MRYIQNRFKEIEWISGVKKGLMIIQLMTLGFFKNVCFSQNLQISIEQKKYIVKQNS